MDKSILVVDDEIDMLQALERFLRRKGFEVHTAVNGNGAVEKMAEIQYDLVISDLAMEGIDGMELLRWVRSSDPNLPFVIMTGVGTIESAVEAIKAGAYNYITKPFKLRDVEILVNRALEYGRLHRRLEHFELLENKQNPEMVFGSSKSIKELLKRVAKISNSDASILIQGETGTGKSVLAKLIHQNSPRADGPFLTIDCGSLAETLLESELFGHVKGAFTSAICAKRGLMEEAQGGTIFLDEIAEIGLPTQVKLLRAIQDRQIKPVGGNRSTEIDVRFISATSVDLKESITENTFREELYYRLAVVPLYMPALRERREDFPLFIDFFLKKFCKLYRKSISNIPPEVLQALYSAEWKGNIRELANVMERSVLLSEDGTISLENVCYDSMDMLNTKKVSDVKSQSLREVVDEAEKVAIVEALKIAQNNRSQAARLLGISRRALYDKMGRFDIE